MYPISIETVTLIAWSKIILAALVVAVLFLLLTGRARAWRMTVLVGVALVVFYLTMSWPLKTMLWGNNGDETFVMAALTQSLKSNPFNDFYYHNLPMFYPPLYFWVVGTGTRIIAQNAISAHKIGVAGTILFWFVGVYLWALLYRRFMVRKEEGATPIWQQPWFWFTVPLLWFLVNEFSSIVFKPYETLSGLLTALFVAFFADAIREPAWRLRHYLFFGISGGVLFLWFYFWWFVAIPVLFALAVSSGDWKKGLIRTIIMGAIMLCIASPFIVPMLLSYSNGIETWQATFFVPGDFNTYAPFATFSWHTAILLLGVAGLLAFYRVALVRGLLYLVVGSYSYQYISIILFLSGGKSLQGSKPFLFFAAAALTVSASYMVVWLWQRLLSTRPLALQRGIAAGLVVLAIPQLPMAQFMDDGVVRRQLEIDHATPKASELAAAIEKNVPDYRTRTWLTSGNPELNGYIPMHYYIAFNPHFSNPASQYSKRYAYVETLATSTPMAFVQQIATSTIDALLLIKNEKQPFYPLYFWQDNYPNGGKDVRIDLPKKNVDALKWKRVYEDEEWLIFLK